jgi:hypothetical protein
MHSVLGGIAGTGGVSVRTYLLLPKGVADEIADRVVFRDLLNEGSSRIRRRRKRRGDS